MVLLSILPGMEGEVLYLVLKLIEDLFLSIYIFDSNWLDVNLNYSFTEYNITDSAFTNGRILHIGGLSSSKGGESISLPKFKEPLAPLSDFSDTNHISIIFSCITNGSVSCAFNWNEVY